MLTKSGLPKNRPCVLEPVTNGRGELILNLFMYLFFTGWGLGKQKGRERTLSRLHAKAGA